MIKCPACQSKIKNKVQITQADGATAKANHCTECGLHFYYLENVIPNDLITQKMAAYRLGCNIQAIHQRITMGTLIGYKLNEKGNMMVSAAAIDLLVARKEASMKIAEQVSDGGRNDPSENFG